LTSAHGAAQTAQLNAQQTTLDAEVSAYGSFASSLDTLQQAAQSLETSSQLAGFDATVADPTIATASTDSDAVAGQYTLLVSNLATGTTLTSQPFTSANSVVGTGTLTLSVGDQSTAISIDSSDNTLASIASAINSAPGNPGVTASIITASDGARLVLSGTATGAANAVTVTESGGDGGLSSLVYDPASNDTTLTQTQQANDAVFYINGYRATSPSNSVSGAITGVTLNLVGASAANTTTTLTVSPDTKTATTSIGNFVTALNGAISTIQSLTSYDASTQTAGTLNGDATLETFQNQLEDILDDVNQSNPGSIKSLADLGITANTDGSYSSDPTTLSNALTGSLSSVASLLGGTNGIATQIDNLIQGYTETGGLIDNINQGLESSLTSVAAQQTQLNAQLATYSATLTTEYNAMDTAVAQLKETQQYLTAEFNASSSSSTSSTSSSTNSSLGSGNLSV
jgi:flagellar hook-associated protein 2